MKYLLLIFVCTPVFLFSMEVQQYHAAAGLLLAMTEENLDKALEKGDAEKAKRLGKRLHGLTETIMEDSYRRATKDADAYSYDLKKNIEEEARERRLRIVDLQAKL